MNPFLCVGLNPSPEGVERVGDLLLGGGQIPCGEGGRLGAAAVEVELDFRLRPGWAHGKASAIGEVDHQHFFFRHRIAFDVGEVLFSKVPERLDGGSVDGGGRLGRVGLDQALDLGGALGPFKGQAPILLEVKPVGGVDFIQQLGQGEVSGFGPGCDLGKHDGRAVAVLVADEICGAVPVAFLAAADVEAGVLEAEGAGFRFGKSAVFGAGLGRESSLVLAEFLADVFESREGFDAADSVFFGDGALEVGGDKGFNQDAAAGVFGGDDALFEQFGDPVIGHQGADLVPGEQLEVARAGPDGNAHPVAVRVGGDHQVRVLAFGECDGHGERLGVFRVGRLDGGEAAVGRLLFRDGAELEPEFLEDGFDDGAAGAVDGGEDDPEAGRGADECGIKNEGFETLEVGGIVVIAQDGEGPALGFLDGLIGVRGDGIDPADDGARVGFHDLGAVPEIDLVAVVVGRVVAGGDHHTALRVFVADSERELRRGAGSLEKADVAAVLSGNACGQFGEFLREKPGVMGDDEFGAAGEAGLGHPVPEVGDEALGGAAHVEIVHGVGANAGHFGAAEGLRGALFRGGHPAADGAASEAAGAKGEGSEETVVEFGPCL